MRSRARFMFECFDVSVCASIGYWRGHVSREGSVDALVSARPESGLWHDFCIADHT